MGNNNKFGACVALIAAFWTAATFAAVGEPNYVVFSIMGPQTLGPVNVNGIVQPESVWDSIERTSVEEIRKAFGEQHAGQQRYVGFSVSLTPTLNLQPDQLKAQVVRALDLAERNNIPVFLHLDDQHFWWANPALSRNSEMVEWSDFPKPGESHGPVVPRYWLNWGDPAAVYPASPPCFACPAFRTAISKRLKECVAEPIALRLQRWREQRKDYLFAGVASGNETQVPDFSGGYDGYAGKPGEAAGSDMTQNPPVKVRMSREDMVPIGYHSLYAMGYSRQSIERLAQAQHTSVNRIVQDLLFKVAHDYAEVQAKTLWQSGLPKERIYTHFTSTNHSLKVYRDRLKESEDRSRAGSGNLSPPVESSVNPYSRPGFTVVRSAVDLNELVAQLRKAHAPETGKTWAVVESYACTGQPGISQTEKQYEEYLGGLVAHGAKVVNVYGWNINDPPNNPYSVKHSGVIPAVKKWLSGERLPSTWFCSGEVGQMTAIHSKLPKLQQAARDLVGRGGDPRRISAVLDSFQSEFEPLVKAGKLSEAVAAIDRAIARLEAQR